MVTYLLLAVLVWLLAARLAFLPPAPSYGAEDPGIVLLEAHAAPTLALRYHAPLPGAPVLLLSHGNAEDLGHIASYQRSVAARGLGICAWDYPGYGASGGSPGFAATEAGIRQVYHWLVEEQGVAPSRIVIWGRSLGSGPSCWLLPRVPVAGIVVESGFTSLYRVVTGVRVFPFDRWDNQAALTASPVPVLVIHGEDDRVIPSAHGKALAAAVGAGVETLWLPGVGHNDPDDGRKVDAIVAFAQACVRP